MSEFRFSPRPNRAGEIDWMGWSADAFARAAAEDRPILLSISAVWCHWCHVMDETTYSDPAVIETINRRFVPIRVDNDKRPDVNSRYNMGGWPTTAFLTPSGRTLTGATYLPPAQMRRALDEIARFYSEHKIEIDELPAPQTQSRTAEGSSQELSGAPIAHLLEALEAGYDQQYGGFGEEPKFPQAESLEFLLVQWRATGEPRWYEMVARTILGMSRGGTYDHVEGGFFRYSTTRDWSVPHFEKMAEDHAGLLRVLAELVLFARNDEFRETLVSATNYVQQMLRDEQTQLYAGSQDADEEYYALALEQRRALASPFVDRTSYTNWTCALAGALCLVSRALDDDALLAQANATLDAVAERLVGPDGLLYHVLVPGGAPEVRGLLTDHVAYCRALLDAHEISGEERFFVRAQAVAQTTIEHFGAPGGGFYDRRKSDERLGNLAIEDRPIVDNGLFAECLLRLQSMGGSVDGRERAGATLAFFAPVAEHAGTFGATYARALARYLAPEIAVRIAGDPPATDSFREAALRLPSPFLSIRTLTPAQAEAENLPPQPAAYVCVGVTCGAPIARAQEMREAYDAVRMKVSQYQQPQSPAVIE
ncbi:MAG TPA: DUF255 domain-containing protein [Candidatus Cybelea sp.]|jgi:hypothetical protein|nr:DUF255 domain-containing protein [Candidatus Cybelea sp.]